MAKKNPLKQRLTLPQDIAGLQKWFAIDKDILEADDRVAAIVSVAVLDEHLRLAIEHRFLVKQDSELTLLEQSQALGSLGAKIELAWAMGLIGKSARNDFKLLKDIRNAFAHMALVEYEKNWESMSFETEAIAKLCQKLCCVDIFVNIDHAKIDPAKMDEGMLIGDVPRLPPPVKPRDRFLSAYKHFKAGLWSALHPKTHKDKIVPMFDYDKLAAERKPYHLLTFVPPESLP